jgi:hypothetical protein
LQNLASDVVTAKYKQQGLVPTKELLKTANDNMQKGLDRANQLKIAEMRIPKDASGIR